MLMMYLALNMTLNNLTILKILKILKNPIVGIEAIKSIQ